MVVMEQSLADRSYTIVELDTNHHTTATNLFDLITLRQVSQYILADIMGVLYQVLLLHDIQHSQRCCHSQVVTTKGGTEHALSGLEYRRNQHTTAREAVGHTLSHSDDIRTDAIPLMRKELTSTTIAALNLV